MWEIKQGNALMVLKTMPDNSAQTCVTSPPYWGLRDYGVEGQLGLEPTPEEYVRNLVEVFREVKRALRDDGTLWLNLGDTYAGSGGPGEWSKRKAGKQEYVGPVGSNPNRKPLKGLKPKDLVGIPWRVAFALQADGWYLRSDIIWNKPNPMPESVTDRPTKAHEYIFLLSKSAHYYYDYETIKEPVASVQTAQSVSFRRSNSKRKQAIPGQSCGTHRTNRKDTPLRDTRNKRSVWNIPTRPYRGAHFAVFPPDLIEPCILAGCPEGGIVLDPFMGSGTTLEVATRWHRRSVGIELKSEYIEIAKSRLSAVQTRLIM